jgi:hypothetical protein
MMIEQEIPKSCTGDPTFAGVISREIARVKSLPQYRYLILFLEVRDREAQERRLRPNVRKKSVLRIRPQLPGKRKPVYHPNG